MLLYPRQWIASSVPEDVDEQMYGGAVGGGKSEWLLLEAHWQIMELVEARGFKDQAIIFRRTFPEVQENIDRSADIIGDAATFKAKNDRWEYPGGSFLYFGHMQHDRDVQKYKSRQFFWIGLDELTTFTEFQWRYIKTRNRTTTPGLRAWMRSASNPGDIGHVYVYENYINVSPVLVKQLKYYFPIDEFDALWREIALKYPMWSVEAAHEETLPAFYEELARRPDLTWQAYPEGTTGKPGPYDVWQLRETPEMLKQNERRADIGLPPLVPPSRVFIPSHIIDNPSLSIDGQYEASLYASQDKETVQALVDGDWTSFKGQVFKEFKKKIEVVAADGTRTERPWHVVPDFSPPPHWPKWRGIDWGRADPMAVYWMTRNPETGQKIVYRELYEADLSNQEACRRILEMSFLAEGPITLTGGDPGSFRAKSSSDEDAVILAEVYKELGVPITFANNDRIQGKQMVHQALDTNLETGEPNMVICESCTNLIRILPQLVYKTEGNVEDVNDKSEDHAYDGLRYTLMVEPSLYQSGVTLAPIDINPYGSGSYPRVVNLGRTPRRGRRSRGSRRLVFRE